MGNLAGKATSQRTAPEATRSTTPRTAMSGDEAPLGGVAELEDAIDGSSSDSSDRCIAGGKGKRRRGSGTDGSTPAVGGRHRGLSRSLPERVDSPDCAPFGGSLVRERPALAPVPAAKCAGFSESRLASASTTLSLRKACDRCVHVKKKCDGNTPCALCMKSHRKCIRSGPKKRHFSGDSSPPRTSGGRNSGGRGSRSEEGLPPRCRHEGCPQPALHGRKGGRPLWCQVHVVSQSPDQPKRCAVLRRTNSGNYLACWKETDWGWPGKAPNRCERHRAEGQQRQEVVEVVSLLKGVFAQAVWPTLRRRGWRQETMHCGGPHSAPYSLWMPPNVSRGTKSFNHGVDYFDTKPLVITYCLRTEEHHGWLMKQYRDLKAQRPPPTAGQTRADSIIPKPRDSVHPPGSRTRGGGERSTRRTAHPLNKQTEKTHTPSPAKPGGFTHHLFSISPSPKRARRDWGVGSNGAGKIPPPGSLEVRLREKLEHLGPQQPHRLAQSLHTSRRAAKLKAQGLDSALVAKMGLIYSEQAMAGFLATMGGLDGSTGGAMAALAASLPDFDRSTLAKKDDDVASTSKRDFSELYCTESLDWTSVPLASGDHSQAALDTQRGGVVEGAAERMSAEGPRHKQAGAPTHDDHVEQALLERAEALSLAQVRLMCDSDRLRGVTARSKIP